MKASVYMPNENGIHLYFSLIIFMGDTKLKPNSVHIHYGWENQLTSMTSLEMSVCHIAQCTRVREDVLSEPWKEFSQTTMFTICVSDPKHVPSLPMS